MKLHLPAHLCCYQRAESLIGQYGVSPGLRALDALQLAVALDLHQNGLINLFVAADRILCTVAAKGGLETVDPESAPM